MASSHDESGFRTVGADDPDTDGGEQNDAEWYEPADELDATDPSSTDHPSEWEDFVEGMVTKVNPDAGDWSTGVVEIVSRNGEGDGFDRYALWMRNTLGRTFEDGDWSEGDEIRIGRQPTKTYQDSDGNDQETTPLLVAVKSA